MALSFHVQLMFQNGDARAAIGLYEAVFDDFTVEHLDTFGVGGAGPIGHVRIAICTLLGGTITCFDIPAQPDFEMTPAIALSVQYASRIELDDAFETLSDGGEVLLPLDDYGLRRRCGQLSDRHGVPWALGLVELGHPTV